MNTYVSLLLCGLNRYLYYIHLPSYLLNLFHICNQIYFNCFSTIRPSLIIEKTFNQSLSQMFLCSTSENSISSCIIHTFVDLPKNIVTVSRNMYYAANILAMTSLFCPHHGETFNFIIFI